MQLHMAMKGARQNTSPLHEWNNIAAKLRTTMELFEGHFNHYDQCTLQWRLNKTYDNAFTHCNMFMITLCILTLT